MTKQPEYRKTLDEFYSSQQIKKYTIQFMAVFSGMNVSSGKNDYNSENDLIPVQIRYGHADRIVDAILSGNTTNKPVRLPIMSAKVTGLSLNYEGMKGMDQTSREVFLPRGEIIPDGLRVIHTYVPNPILLTYDLSIRTSNTKHLFEILEQILLIFNPTIQLQTSDRPFDWTKLHTIDLKDIAFDDNFPAGQDRRIVGATLTFQAKGWISAPADIKDKLIKKVMLRVDAIPTFSDVNEVVNDISRLIPDYDVLFDIEDFDIPKK